MTSDHNRSELRILVHSNDPSSSKLVPKVVPLAVKTATSRQELELLFHHHIAMLRTIGPRPTRTEPIDEDGALKSLHCSHYIKFEPQRSYLGVLDSIEKGYINCGDLLPSTTQPPQINQGGSSRSLCSSITCSTFMRALKLMFQHPLLVPVEPFDFLFVPAVLLVPPCEACVPTPAALLVPPCEASGPTPAALLVSPSEGCVPTPAALLVPPCEGCLLSQLLLLCPAA
ncbi:hypothetical protein Tco_0250254 [Tanacetum coccineum]